MNSYRKLNENSVVPGRQTGTVAKILIVEDEQLVSWSLAEALERVGFETMITISGESAIEKFQQSHFDLVITDWKLPQIDGFHVARFVKTKSPNVPVFIMSASDLQFNQDTSITKIVDRFIEKPFNLKDVTALVSTYITKNQRSC